MYTPREMISISEIKPLSSLSGLGLKLAYMHGDTISIKLSTVYMCEDCTDKTKFVAMYFR